MKFRKLTKYALVAKKILNFMEGDLFGHLCKVSSNSQTTCRVTKFDHRYKDNTVEKGELGQLG